VQRIVGHLADAVLDRLHWADGVDVAGDGDADLELVVAEELLVKLDVIGAGVAVADRGEADGVVVVEELKEALGGGRIRWVLCRKIDFDESGGVAKDSREFSRGGVFSAKPPLPSVTWKSFSIPEASSQAIEEASGPWRTGRGCWGRLV